MIRFFIGLVITVPVIVLLSLPAWIEPTVLYGAVAVGAVFGGALGSAYRPLRWRWLRGLTIGIVGGVAVTAVVWALLEPSPEFLPRHEVVTDIIARTTPSAATDAVDRDWIKNRAPDQMTYLAFGVGNTIVAAGFGLIGGVLASGPRRRRDEPLPGRATTGRDASSVVP